MNTTTSKQLNTTLQDLKAISILDVATHLGLNPVKAGSTYSFKSPLHRDENPSGRLFLDTNRFQDFSRDVGGDVIDLVQYTLQCDFKDAKGVLNDFLGNVSTKTIKTRHGSKYEAHASGRSHQTDYQVNETLLKFLIPDGLTENRFSKAGLQYLKNRGLTDMGLTCFDICEVTDYNKTNSFLKAHFTIERLQNSGLMNSKGNLIFFAHRLLIPIFEGGLCSGFKGRYFLDGNSKPVQGQSKYINQKGLPIKSRFFNQDSIAYFKPYKPIWIVEGEFDTVLLNQSGRQAIGLLGASNLPNDDAILRLRDFEHINILLDNDEAGQSAGSKLAQKIADTLGRSVNKARFKGSVKDISEYYETKQLTI